MWEMLRTVLSPEALAFRKLLLNGPSNVFYLPVFILKSSSKGKIVRAVPFLLKADCPAVFNGTNYPQTQVSLR